MNQPVKAQIEELCNRYGVELFVLFGSRATGDATESSDTDVAALFDRPISAKEELDFFCDVQRLYQTDRVDVVVLDKADPVLLKHVALYGRPLYERSRAAFDYFIMRAMAKYQDTAENRRIQRQLLDQFLEEHRGKAV